MLDAWRAMARPRAAPRLAASDDAPELRQARGERRRGPELRQERGERCGPDLLLGSRATTAPSCGKLAACDAVPSCPPARVCDDAASCGKLAACNAARAAPRLAASDDSDRGATT
jgi:hypothetical protein